MDDESPRSFWRTLPGVLTATAAVITAVSALIGALAAAGFLTGSGTSPSSADGVQPSPVTAAAELRVAAARLERGCLDFWGDPPAVCACFGTRLAEALPELEADAASQRFRSEGTFAERAQDDLARDTRTLCLES